MSTSFTAAVSFAKTPVSEVSSLHDEIIEAGWQEGDRGDPWAVMYRKSIVDPNEDNELELREVMGDYWLDADGISALRDK